MATRQAPFADTRLGSQMFLFPRAALRGTWGNEDLEAVLTSGWFGPTGAAAVTGAAITAQAAQGLASDGAASAVAPPVTAAPVGGFRWSPDLRDEILYLPPAIRGEVRTLQRPQVTEVRSNHNMFARDFEILQLIWQLEEAA